MESLLRFGGTNSPALTSKIFSRMPLTFGNIRARNMVTLWNPHLDRIAAAPAISFDATTAGHYQYNGSYPKTTGVAAPNYASTTALPANSEFTADWRSNLAAKLRVNLNRKLTEYPAPSAGVIDTTNPQYNLAVSDRQAFARDIYDALIRVTGAQDPNGAPGMVNTSAEYKAARWLAQLAVNIVDYIDADDYLAPFNWYPAAAGADGWVFGTELPRLVLNEVYAQCDNDGNDPAITGNTGNDKKASYYQLNLWAELHNPFKNTPAGSTYPLNGGAAHLQVGNYAAYEIVVCPSASTAASLALSTYLRDPSNNLGAPVSGYDALTAAEKTALGYQEVNDWGTTAITTQVLPANGASADGTQTNQGFYVLGPTTSVTGNPAFLGRAYDPSLPKSYSTSQMSVKVNDATAVVAQVTLLLRRLANPHLPPQTSAAQPNYNPYITVDYLDAIKVWDDRKYDANGKIDPMPPMASNNSSFGRRHPYAAYNAPAWDSTVAYAVNSFVTSDGGTYRSIANNTDKQPPNATYWVSTAAQVGAQTGGGNGMMPENTFYSLNSNVDTPFTWLTHLDRPLVNQLELLHVSGFKPHELTQQFVYPAGGTMKKFQHYAPWSDSASLIYRALDLLGTPSAMAGTVRGGRWHGNINLNTLTEWEILQALCDPQDAQVNPLFRSTDIYDPANPNNPDTIFNKLIMSRTKNATPSLLPTGEGNPFRSFADGDIAKTWLRPDSSGVFAVPGLAASHPYAQRALLQKIFNNITSTSNVFAMWWTVGFFEVVDESVRPQRLGKEVGRDQNRHIRHRFFAIVDRSGLQLPLFSTTVPWSVSKTYSAGDVALYNGASYRCIQANVGVPPPNPVCWTASTLSSNQVAASTSPQTLTLQYPLTGTTSTGVPLQFVPGMLLEIDTGANAEVVAVTGPDPNAGAPSFTTGFSAVFTKAHASGVAIVCRGNPGPKESYNPRTDNDVVLHLSVIR